MSELEDIRGMILLSHQLKRDRKVNKDVALLSNLLHLSKTYPFDLDTR